MLTKDDILNMIEEEDVEFIRLQFTDMFGNLKNIAVTPGQMERVLNNKYSFEGSVIFDGKYEYPDDLYLHPVLDTFVILPWRPQQGKVGKFLCDICYEDGTLFEMSSRSILKKVLEDAKKKGYSFYIHPECEFFLYHTDENGNPTTTTHEVAGYMDVGPVDFGENARRDMVLALEEMGFEVEASCHEKAPAQHQIEFKAADALQIADSIMTFKFAVRSIAKRFGLYATFMPKPRTENAGSGMHFNMAVYKDDHNILKIQDGKCSEDAMKFMGGVMKHALALTSVCNPIVNSYKRILSAASAPNTIGWSLKGSNPLLKVRNIMGDSSIEFRFPDASANPYIAIAACIAAGIDGIDNNADAGEDCYKNGKLNKNVKKLPDNLKEAVEALNNDEYIRDVLGKEFSDIYGNAKIEEWNDYMKEVSDWEINRYLYKM